MARVDYCGVPASLPAPPTATDHTRPNHTDREPRGPIGENFFYCVKAV